MASSRTSSRDHSESQKSPSRISNSSLDQIISIEINALLALFESTNGPKWRNSKNWNLDKKPLGKWQGIETNESNRVSKIRLLMNELSGTIPDSICELNDVVYLDMSNNKLVGGIPTEICKLGKLRELKLHYNQLSGSIPENIGCLTSLKGLHLESNSFTGSIPHSIGNLNMLTKLNLGLSQLSGSIPLCILQLTSLQELKLNNNRLSGAIPRGLHQLTSLKMLCLNDNKLDGEIPPELGSMTSLRKLHLHNNALTGRLPNTFRNAAHLAGGLKVENNRLVGPQTVLELNQMSTRRKFAYAALVLLLLACVYLAIPLVLPFTGGICLHNHIHFRYPPSSPDTPGGVSDGSFSLYKGLTAAQLEHMRRTGAPGDAAVTCSIPPYCTSLHLHWAFPFLLHRTVTLSEPEAIALFDAVDSSDSAHKYQRVAFHVVSVTPTIAQRVADTVAASVVNPALSFLAVIKINALESVLPIPARAILIDALADRQLVQSDLGSQSPLQIQYNGNDVTAQKLSLHIRGISYLFDYWAQSEAVRSLLRTMNDLTIQLWQGGAASAVEAEQPTATATSTDANNASSAASGGFLQRLADLIECSLQFDLTHHPKCVSSRSRLTGSSRASKPVDTKRAQKSSTSQSGALETFLTQRCGLTARVSHQLHSVLGVDVPADLALLRPSDLQEVLQLPLIPQRKLALCVCDAAVLPLREREISVSSRPLCAQGGGAGEL